jgi:hypothetical protein
VCIEQFYPVTPCLSGVTSSNKFLLGAQLEEERDEEEVGKHPKIFIVRNDKE